MGLPEHGQCIKDSLEIDKCHVILYKQDSLFDELHGVWIVNHLKFLA